MIRQETPLRHSDGRRLWLKASSTFHRQAFLGADTALGRGVKVTFRRKGEIQSVLILPVEYSFAETFLLECFLVAPPSKDRLLTAGHGKGSSA